MSKRFYWLKFSKDFFKDHKIRILESFPNGEKYLLFYIKLMAESVSHEGRLRFSDAIPYSEQMLAAITNTDVDTVRSAIEALKQMQLIEILDDQTLFLTQVQDIIGSENESAERVRAFRARQNAKALQCNDNVTEVTHNVTERLEIRDKSIENTLSNNTPVYINDNAGAREENEVQNVENHAPTLREVIEYFQAKGLAVSPIDFYKYYSEKGWRENWKANALTWESHFKQTPAYSKEKFGLA